MRTEARSTHALAQNRSSSGKQLPLHPARTQPVALEALSTMFGENPSESARLPSPWDTPQTALSRQGTPATNHVAAEQLPVDEIDHQLSDLSLFDTDPSPQQMHRSDSAVSREARGARKLGSLSAESDLHGQVEYKLKLSNVSPDRFNRLTTQLKWRLLEGGGEALYEIGVLDDGTLVGLPRSELILSIKCLERMAEELGATVLVVREIRLPAAGAEDSAGSRRRWESFRAGLEQAAADGFVQRLPKKCTSPDVYRGPGKRKYVREKKWQEAMGAGARTGGEASSTGVTSDSASTPPTPSYIHAQHRCSSSSSGPSQISLHSESTDESSSASYSAGGGLTQELAPFTSSQSRSVTKKKYGSILDDAPVVSRPSKTALPVPRADGKPHRRPRRPKGPPPAVQEQEQDSAGIFDMFDLSEPFSGPFDSLVAMSSTKPSPSATKKQKDDFKAAKNKARKALLAEQKPQTGPSGGGGNDEWEGQSLDVWSDAPRPTSDRADGDVALLTLGAAVDETGGCSATTAPSSEVVLLEQLPIPTAPNASVATSPPTASSESLTPSPSPLLVPTYRPPPSLLPRAFPPQADRGLPSSLEPSTLQPFDDQDEDGSERLCVEVLVVRKDMQSHLNLEDFAAKWDAETVTGEEEMDD